ncbi:hypothetical protein Poli38472_001356 [Pythium oligandrum]|uniref:Tubulin-folding cofactor C n=1 Tax=Pythium oligandrum TaxID=41045 RepID=A0A8K1CV18_PYTOL|nr:hypothetical protein Poli38472_001356 [Pythium oligandrum]|eukprot:TMW69200.1 hypothetical protein Poli38472_001356 [Pythium oligandrum]
MTDGVTLGQRCELLSSGTGLRASLKRYGQVAYIGSVEGLPAGEWIGVKLDKPLGKNDGSVNGVRYFECAMLHGAFVRREKMNTQGAFPVLDAQEEGEERRKQIEEKRRQDRLERAVNLGQSADELVQEFWKRFMEHEDHVRKQIGVFVDQKKQPVPCDPAHEIRLDDLVVGVNAMREESATAASLYLSPYDIRQTQLILNKLLDLIETTRTTFAPRKKFTFKARARKTATTSTDRGDNNTEKEHSTSSPTSTKATETNAYVNPDELVFADRQSEVIVIDQSTFTDGDSSKRRDLSFSRLVNCVIFVSVETSAIRGDDLKNCVVYTGPIWGSLWLEHCHNCDFFAACRQLRVHLSSSTNFHLRIASHPIIEDCHQLRFGPYKLWYAQLNEQLERSGLKRDTGLWAKVNDFKWHKAQQSPNWSQWDPKQSMPTIPTTLQSLLRYE